MASYVAVKTKRYEIPGILSFFYREYIVVFWWLPIYHLLLELYNLICSMQNVGKWDWWRINTAKNYRLTYPPSEVILGSKWNINIDCTSLNQKAYKTQTIFLNVSLKTKNWKDRKKILKICKKLTNLQNTKTLKQTNLSVFCKSNYELNNIF